MKKQIFGLLSLLCLLSLFSFGTAVASLSDGLVAYYPFNGDTLDHSGNGRNGIAYGGATYTTDVDGNLNSAYQFDGVNDYIKIAHHTSLNISGDFSISFWATRDLAGGTQVMLAKGRDCSQSYFFGWSGPARFNINPTTSCPGMTAIGTAFPLQEWHFVTAVIDNTNLKLRYYLDGVLVSEKSIVRSIISNTYPLVIGRHFTAANGTGGYEYYFKGKIDELRLYNRVLSEEEIQALYRLNQLTTLAYRTQIGQQLRDYIEYFRNNDLFHLLPLTGVYGNTSAGWLEKQIIQGDSLLCEFADIRIELDRNIISDIELTATLIHEITHYRDSVVASQTPPYEINVGNTEILAHANTYLYFLEAITDGNYTAEEYNVLGPDLCNAMETCWEYTVGIATREEAINSLLGGGRYSQETLNMNLDFICVPPY